MSAHALSAWALAHREQFPVDVNRAPRELLLRVPGLGVRTVNKLIASRRQRAIRAADLHETDYTPWEGHDIFAWPVVTISRGKVMVENGQYFGSPDHGRYLKRKISSDILNGATP